MLACDILSDDLWDGNLLGITGASRGSKFAALKAAEEEQEAAVCAQQGTSNEAEAVAPVTPSMPQSSNIADEGDRGARFAALKAAEAEAEAEAGATIRGASGEAAAAAGSSNVVVSSRGSKFAALKAAEKAALGDYKQHQDDELRARDSSGTEAGMREQEQQQHEQHAADGRQRGAKFAALKAAEQGT